MGNEKIKSALEIALEKIKSMDIPEEELKKTGYLETGKKIAGKYLQTVGEFSLKGTLESYSGKERKHIKEGIEFSKNEEIVDNKGLTP